MVEQNSTFKAMCDYASEVSSEVCSPSKGLSNANVVDNSNDPTDLQNKQLSGAPINASSYKLDAADKAPSNDGVARKLLTVRRAITCCYWGFK